MRYLIAVLSLFLILGGTAPSFAQDEKKPEHVIERMSMKLVRGVTNVATSVVELPKQTYLSVRDMGAVGYVVGPIKGIGMTVYRAFMGGAETALFLVPQPGYYDPMINPDYVWNGWEEYRPAPDLSKAGNPAAEEKKGEADAK